MHPGKPFSIQMRSLSTVSTAVVLMLMTACSSSGPKSDVPAVSTSPFYTGKSSDTGGVQVNTLRTFGDSYTDFGYTDPRGQKNWSRELVNSGLASKQENYAVGGARAQAGTPNAFEQQVSRWDAANSPIEQRDLTVAYFGYNDIGRNGATAMGAAKAGYTQGINYLLARGAANGNNRIFVTQIHDWSRNPGVDSRLGGQVVDWNNHVASIANSNPNIIAVDLYTVFNRVFENPAEFGLVNSTAVDKERSYTDYLFFESIHFGTKGQEIISRVFRHYLTRGWNWASAIEAGGAASAQLNKDLDNNLLAFQYSKQAGAYGSLRFLPLTTTENALIKEPKDGYAFTRHQIKGISNSFDSVKPLGLALDFGSIATATSGSRLGVAFTQNMQAKRLANIDERSSMRFNSTATTLYWLKPHANFLISTQMSRINHGYDQTGHDDLVNRVVSNERSGHTWALEGKVRYTHRLQGATITPWASLSQYSHTLEAGNLRSVYTTDVRFSSTRANDVYSGLGFDVQFDPLSLSGGKKLHLAGGIHHTQSLKRDSLQMRMQEQIAPDVNMVEIIERPGVKQTQLGLNAQLELSKLVRLDAAYSVDLQNPRSSQAIRVTTGIRF